MNDLKSVPVISWDSRRRLPAHTLSNPFDRDLVYLMAGERNPNDVVHYPRIRRSMIKGPGRRRWVDWDDLHEL